MSTRENYSDWLALTGVEGKVSQRTTEVLRRRVESGSRGPVGLQLSLAGKPFPGGTCLKFRFLNLSPHSRLSWNPKGVFINKLPGRRSRLNLRCKDERECMQGREICTGKPRQFCWRGFSPVALATSFLTSLRSALSSLLWLEGTF